MLYGAFVVLSGKGLFWDGADWTGELSQARRFVDGPDPWADCNEVAERLTELGISCQVAYIPRSKRRPA